MTSLFTFLYFTESLDVRWCILKEIAIGVLAAFFFGFTFIFNHSMESAGGSWLWSASLRYFFMLPFLIAIVIIRGVIKSLQAEVKRAPSKWLLWSFVGFVLFYAPLTNNMLIQNKRNYQKNLKR